MQKGRLSPNCLSVSDSKNTKSLGIIPLADRLRANKNQTNYQDKYKQNRKIEIEGKLLGSRNISINEHLKQKNNK